MSELPLPVTLSISVAQLAAVCGYAPAARLTTMKPYLDASLVPAQATTPMRAAMYLAQLAHESGEFRYLEELAGGWAYDPTVNPRLAERLGNTQPGDGSRYKGRGAIQLTGRGNYARAGAALGLPLVEQPELAALPEHAFDVAAWFWQTYGCNAPADIGDVAACTRIINGGLNGLVGRQRYYARARAVMVDVAQA